MASSAPPFDNDRGVFAPGMRLFRNLPFVGKAALICGVFLLVVAQLGYLFLDGVAKAIADAERERTGLALANEVLPMFARVQVLRSQVSVAEGRDAAAVTASLADIESRLTRIETAAAASGLELADAVKYTRQSFAPLKTPAADTQEAFVRVDEFSSQVQRLMDDVADTSGLSLDPEFASYHLAIASMNDTLDVVAMLGRVRDLGSASIARKEADPFARRIMHGEAYALYRHVERLFADYEVVTKHNETIGKAVAFQPAFDPVNSFMRLSRKTALVEAGPRGDAAEFAAQGTKAMESLLGLSGRSFAALGAVFEERMASLRRGRDLALAGVAVGMLAAAYLFGCFYRVTQAGLAALTHHIQALAAGDLSTTPRPRGKDEVAGVMRSLQAMQEALRTLIGQVRECADEILTASSEVAAGSDDLSQRTEAAASRLQQTTSTMDTIAHAVRDTAQRVAESAELGQGTARSAENSRQVIGEVVSTMDGIQTASRRVADIIGTIDAIAFQTNILALNAAVEAARAGEHGRGFAVVAGEVRSLAQRSAEAAREIKALIADSTERTEGGTRIVHDAGRGIGDLVQAIGSISTLLAQVRELTEQQTRSVGEVSASVAELDRDTQHNAALVEQTSAAAISMKGKAEMLSETAARFRLPEAMPA